MTVTEAPKKTETGQPALSPFQSLARAMIKGFVRDKATLFFTFLFPLMFLVIFGLIFGNQSTSKTSIGVVGDGPVIQALGQSPALELKRLGTAEEAARQVKDGDLPGFVAENGTGITLRFAASDQAKAGMIVGMVNGVVDQANIAATGQPPRFTLQTAQIEDSSLKPIQFLTPGILSWAVSIGAVFGAAMTLVNWRRKQVLRRLRLAPISPVTVLGSRVVVTLGVALAQAVIFVGIALLPVFGLKLSGQWWLAVPLLVLGALAFFSIGMLVGAFCKTEEAANGAGNLVILPMAFLSGSFFPTDGLPGWLKAVSNIFPMKHLNTGMTDVMVRGKGFEALLVPGAVLIAFTVVIGFIAAKVFKWEDS
ncbi:ABC transporter permease [Amycolatopsis sp. cg5]|uniref:ABC transporter permease n=1 Tax=Amycolatopsis sp. cg5 TaxID=3238802 RepID=UPI003524E4D8